MSGGRTRPKLDPAPPGGFGTLGDLLARRGLAASTPTPAATRLPPAPRRDHAPDLSRCGKVVVRRERKGHGGKTATVIAGLGLSASDLERLARTVRRALGCGASVAGEQVVVQGDHTERLGAWLTARGVRRLVLGN